MGVTDGERRTIRVIILLRNPKKIKLSYIFICNFHECTYLHRTLDSDAFSGASNYSNSCSDLEFLTSLLSFKYACSTHASCTLYAHPVHVRRASACMHAGRLFDKVLTTILNSELLFLVHETKYRNVRIWVTFYENNKITDIFLLLFYVFDRLSFEVITLWSNTKLQIKSNNLVATVLPNITLPGFYLS